MIIICHNFFCETFICSPNTSSGNREKKNQNSRTVGLRENGYTKAVFNVCKLFFRHTFFFNIKIFLLSFFAVGQCCKFSPIATLQHAAFWVWTQKLFLYIWTFTIPTSCVKKEPWNKKKYEKCFFNQFSLWFGVLVAVRWKNKEEQTPVALI